MYKQTTTMTTSLFIIRLLLISILPQCAVALVSSEPVSKLLAQYAAPIQSLQTAAASTGVDLSQSPYNNDVFYLRYCINDSSNSEAVSKLTENLVWRKGNGKQICDAARSAFEQASAVPGKWNNGPVLTNAPHADKITKYLTPVSCLTTATNTGDLIYCIRAGQIDDTALMKAVTIPEMVEFFLYAKEVNGLVANQRSLASNQLFQVLTANDLSGVKLIGGSADFRSALSISSKQANDLYPNLAGPTLLLNLPPLVAALAKLFTPLFSRAIIDRLRFAKWKLMADVNSLEEISHGNSLRETFLTELDAIVNNR
jgi:hypothetical protein